MPKKQRPLEEIFRRNREADQVEETTMYAKEETETTAARPPFIKPILFVKAF
jgi:hypothetical protein